MKTNQVPSLEFVSWTKLHDLSFKLAKDLFASAYKFDTMVSISRGGHVVSRILSDFLNLSIFNVSIQAYKDIKLEEVKLTQKLGQYLSGQKVLLVDEVIDTGKTLKRALSYVSRLRVKQLVSVALHVKPQASPKPDYYVAQTSKWLVYPYEVRESIASLLPYWRRAGYSKVKMKQILVAGGMKADQVDYCFERFVP